MKYNEYEINGVRYCHAKKTWRDYMSSAIETIGSICVFAGFVAIIVFYHYI